LSARSCTRYLFQYLPCHRHGLFWHCRANWDRCGRLRTRRSG